MVVHHRLTSHHWLHYTSYFSIWHQSTKHLQRKKNNMSWLFTSLVQWQSVHQLHAIVLKAVQCILLISQHDHHSPHKQMMQPRKKKTATYASNQTCYSHPPSAPPSCPWGSSSRNLKIIKIHTHTQKHNHKLLAPKAIHPNRSKKGGWDSLFLDPSEKSLRNCGFARMDLQSVPAFTAAGLPSAAVRYPRTNPNPSPPPSPPWSDGSGDDGGGGDLVVPPSPPREKP